MELQPQLLKEILFTPSSNGGGIDAGALHPRRKQFEESGAFGEREIPGAHEPALQLESLGPPAHNFYINGSMAGRLPDSEVATVNSCKLASPKRCKNSAVVAKRRRPSAPANSSTSFRSRSLTTSPRLSASKSRSISADWLPKGDAGEHFECRHCHLKISARATLFAHICGQGLVFDPGSQQRNHSVENPQLKAGKGELAVERNERGD